MFSGSLQSHKNNNTYDFLFIYDQEYHASIEANIYRFKIWEEGKETDSCFEILFKIIDNGSDLKVIDLFPPDYYRGKGISIAGILKAKEIFKKRIISSSNHAKSEIHEARWDDATEKVWKRLVDRKLAKYNIAKDYYFTT